MVITTVVTGKLSIDSGKTEIWNTLTKEKFDLPQKTKIPLSKYIKLRNILSTEYKVRVALKVHGLYQVNLHDTQTTHSEIESTETCVTEGNATSLYPNLNCTSTEW